MHGSRVAIESVNSDQIATGTDRLLIGGVRKRRPPAPLSAYDVQHEEVTEIVGRRPSKSTKWLRTAIAFVASAAGITIALVCILA
jgi:hypothetical protein